MSIEFLIKSKALELGFDLCGIASCHPLPAERERFDRWTDEGYDGGLDYMRRNVDKRFDPGLLLDGARSVIVCGVGYNRGEATNGGDVPPGAAAGNNAPGRSRIASYALRRDYHDAIKERLQELCSYISSLDTSFSGRAFVDSAPVLEKYWAVEAGLGWIGRNSLLLNRRLGSFLLLGEIVTTLPLAPVTADSDYVARPQEGKDLCGECRRCMEACPNGAIAAPRIIDTRRCISRLTVEGKHALPAADDVNEPRPRLHGWVFGCDECQLCCPYNIKAAPSSGGIFPEPPIIAPTAEEWASMTEEEFARRFAYTSLSRTGLELIKGNVGK